MNPVPANAITTLGQGAPLLFLHNGFDSRKTWDDLLPRFATRHTCIAWDRDGYGVRSDTADRTPKASLEDGVAELAFLMESQPREPLPLVGHCMGGAIALTYAVRHPDRVSHLVLEAVGYYLHPFTVQIIELMKVKWDDLSPRAKEKMARMHGIEASPRTWEHIMAHRESYLMCDTYDIRPLLPRVKVPVLLIQGSRDNLLPPGHAREVQNLFPSAELWEAENLGHDVHNGDAATWSAAVDQFLQGP